MVNAPPRAGRALRLADICDRSYRPGLRGSRVLFRTAAALATELEIAQQQLRLPKLLTQYRRYALVLVDEVGYLPFSQTAAEQLFSVPRLTAMNWPVWRSPPISTLPIGRRCLAMNA